MSDGLTIFGLLFFAALMAVGIVSCTQTWDACKAAGGRPVYEYKSTPSCWDADGRRIFP